MIHALKGRKQSPKHIAKKVKSLLAFFKKNPKKFLDNGVKLMSKIVKKDGCWVWTGAVFRGSSGDYGQMRLGRLGQSKLRHAHVVSYEYYVGKVPKGLDLDHLCRNTLCINPDHLEPVTRKENILRGIGPTAQNARKTHCKRGHRFTKKNTRFSPRGKDIFRVCRKCRKLL